MKWIESQTETTGEPVKLFVQDVGQGKPAVFISDWPLSHEMWEYQFNVLPKHGIRCIGYDRRGFGKSDKPWESYDYNTLAADLKAVLDGLDLHDVTLVGFSMGGGEVVRYLAKYGSERVSKAVLISSVVPYMLQTDDNPDGLPKEVFDGFVENVESDRPKFLAGFAKDFYGNSLLNNAVSDEILNWHSILALQGSGRATTQCIRSFSATDFRNEVSMIDVPVLIIHGDSDKIVPIKISSDITSDLLPGAEYIVYEGAPHGLFVTQKERLNENLIQFINQEVVTISNPYADITT
ncbi:alpha/beta fold hydrolase [Dyadobacter psychrophilus]|uniref:Pimeloyl-ACP methyl ester carboxylesterase n=1 Tax=Dyadobacter psychrophilus TaxID=651661 RepID=A0A1T5DPH9_9BACT|nr:alpha/beta hydrolase [Dyadobacter psychrophilus]SKB73554.1 Pimeloyl-ACP methyl ester carboxylesterase [Dyadobacter psychrophilus]